MVLLWPALAFGAYTEFYVQTTASNMNGGSDNADAAAYTSTNGNWSTTTNVFTPTSGNPSSSGVAVGQFASIYIDAATTPVYIARVTAVSSTTITMSSTAFSGTAPVTSATARTIKCGGAWKGPNAAVAHPFGFITNALQNSSNNSPRVNIKGGTTYAITAAMTHASDKSLFQGYTTSIGDGGKATIDGGTAGASYTLLTISGLNCAFRDLIFANNGATGAAAGVVPSSSGTVLDRCVFHNFTLDGLGATGSGIANECEAYLCNTSNTATSGGLKSSNASFFMHRCISHDNSGNLNNGFVQASGSYNSFVSCIADTNGLNGFLLSGTPLIVIMINCVAYNNTAGAGVTTSANTSQRVLINNSIFASNGTYGVNIQGTGAGSWVIQNSAYYNNTTAATSFGNVVAVDNVGEITLTALPFIDAPNGDFRLNRAFLARGAGRGNFTQTQGSYGNTSMLGYPDVGALQHKEPPGRIPSIGGP